MSLVVRTVGGATLGVSIPIIIEYGAKGARVPDPATGVKISGVAGLALGIPEIIGAYWAHTGKRLKDENVAMLAAMGAAKATTGACILILDELRKRAAYAFRKGRGETLPVTGEKELERIEYPTEELVEEI